MAKNLETIVFDSSQFEKELKAFAALLQSKPDLSERDDIQPIFKKNKHLTAYLGTFASAIGPATELAFEYPFFGDFSADVLLGSKKAGEFCIIELEDGRRDSIFKKAGSRANPEWSARFVGNSTHCLQSKMRQSFSQVEAPQREKATVAPATIPSCNPTANSV